MPTPPAKDAPASAAVLSTNWRERGPQSNSLASNSWRRRTFAPAPSVYGGSFPPKLRNAHSAPAVISSNNIKEGPSLSKPEHCSKVEIGQIVYLPRCEEIGRQSKALHSETHSETFGHPAVVTEIWHDGGLVVIKPITSLDKIPLSIKFEEHRDRDRQFKAHMLIEHPKNTNRRYDNPDELMPTLNIRDGRTLKRPCYVRLDKSIVIETNELHRYLLDGSQQDMYLDSWSKSAIQGYIAPQLYEASKFERPQLDRNQVSQADLKELKRRSIQKAAKARLSASSLGGSSSTSSINAAETDLSGEAESSSSSSFGDPATPAELADFQFLSLEK